MKASGFLALILALFLLFSCAAAETAQIQPKRTAGLSSLGLTDEETAFIAAHPTIRLGVDPKFIPYEFFDSDGIYKGIARII